MLRHVYWRVYWWLRRGRKAYLKGGPIHPAPVRRFIYGRGGERIDVTRMDGT